ncbi:hypothetical protein [Qipengyuania soli]|uniref:DUF4148 domain-containing protein n=1 Tax=Qipengyuania soli TaxID=2782568 RepID=A0A7S8IW01_9SPHN|nr:hypothetical protein [Qipengyuania soli]QPC99421.1 hypothetical protein IRL76_02260 [Qipengyuania soli]
MKSNAICIVLALVSAGAASAAVPMLLEERVAREEEKLILDHPIAGIENSLWFDYRVDVIEAQKELSSDLRRASDIEDKRDAWEEYAVELKNEREDYIHDMAKRGFRQGSVTIID